MSPVPKRVWKVSVWTTKRSAAQIRWGLVGEEGAPGLAGGRDGRRRRWRPLVPCAEAGSASGSEGDVERLTEKEVLEEEIVSSAPGAGKGGEE